MRYGSLRLAVAAVAAVLTLPACAGGPDLLSDAAPPPASVHTVLLVPMNFDATPTGDMMSRGVERVQGQVKRHLEDLGLRVETLRLRRVLRTWNAVLRAAGLSRDDPREVTEQKLLAARGELARRLAAQHPVDVVVMPTVVLRQGEYAGMRLAWDGVTRPVPVESNGEVTMVHGIGGPGMGTSLRATLFTPGGERFFERHVGLEPIHRYVMKGFGMGGTIRAKARTDLFEDDAIIAEVVQQAFEPYLVPSDD